MNYTTCFHILNLIESVNFSDGSNTILSNIDRTRTCPFVDDRTRTPYFWLRTIEPNTVFTTFTKLLIELTRTSCPIYKKPCFDPSNSPNKLNKRLLKG